MFPTPYNSAENQSLSLSKTPKINDLSIWPLLNHIPIRAFISLFIRFSPQIYKIYSSNTSFMHKYSLSILYLIVFQSFIYLLFLYIYPILGVYSHTFNPIFYPLFSIFSLRQTSSIFVLINANFDF